MKNRNAVDPQMVRNTVPDQMIPETLLASKTRQWEYKTLLLPRAADLNRYGLEGWELVSAIPQPGDQAMFYFRKAK